ncbi:hypothetical protein Dimus_036067 [Dionaea muscipula]
MASGCSFVWSGVRFVVARPQGRRCLGRVVSSGGVLLGDGLAGGVVEGQWWFWLLIGMFRASHGCVRCDWVAGRYFFLIFLPYVNAPTTWCITAYGPIVSLH